MEKFLLYYKNGYLENGFVSIYGSGSICCNHDIEASNLAHVTIKFTTTSFQNYLPHLEFARCKADYPFLYVLLYNTREVHINFLSDKFPIFKKLFASLGTTNIVEQL